MKSASLLPLPHHMRSCLIFLNRHSSTSSTWGVFFFPFFPFFRLCKRFPSFTKVPYLLSVLSSSKWVKWGRVNPWLGKSLELAIYAYLVCIHARGGSACMLHRASGVRTAEAMLYSGRLWEYKEAGFASPSTAESQLLNVHDTQIS